MMINQSLFSYIEIKNEIKKGRKILNESESTYFPHQEVRLRVFVQDAKNKNNEGMCYLGEREGHFNLSIDDILEKCLSPDVQRVNLLFFVASDEDKVEKFETPLLSMKEEGSLINFPVEGMHPQDKKVAWCRGVNLQENDGLRLSVSKFATGRGIDCWCSGKNNQNCHDTIKSRMPTVQATSSLQSHSSQYDSTELLKAQNDFKYNYLVKNGYPVGQTLDIAGGGCPLRRANVAFKHTSYSPVPLPKSAVRKDAKMFCYAAINAYNHAKKVKYSSGESRVLVQIKEDARMNLETKKCGKLGCHGFKIDCCYNFEITRP